MASALVSRSADQPEQDASFKQALALRHLLPPDPANASDALDQLRRAVGENSPLYQVRARQFRVALEEQGQVIILKYLQGDQVTQNEADFRRGAAYFQRAIDLAPDAAFDRSRLRFCEGRALIFQKDYVRAAELLEQAIRLDPGHSYAHNALGIAYLEQVPTNGNFFQPAVAAFRDAIRLSPYWAYPRHNLGLTLTQRGAYAEAEVEYGAAMRLAPRYSYLPYNAGLLQQQLNRIDEARAYYRKAVKVAEGRCADRLGASFTVCPERSAPLTALASITGRRTRAVQLFNAAIHDDPTDVSARHDLAVLLSRGKSGKAEAETLWKAILAEQPGYLPALLAYSDFLKGEHRFAESVPFYRAILTQRGDYVPASIDLATALTMSGHAAESLALLDKLLPANQQNPGLWAARAQALESIGEKEKAADASRTARNLKKRS
jgi:tetratricopeptide (TPR) repeat protein